MRLAQETSSRVILIVEDEPLVRMIGADLLEEAGFDVLEACNADEALRVLDSRSDVKVVFTDIEMPGSLDGLALARRIRDRWPSIGVVLTSGRCGYRQGAAENDNQIMPKPYSGAALVQRVEEAMARGA